MRVTILLCGVLWATTAGAAPKICGLPSGSGLHTFADSLAEIAADVSPQLSDGLAEALEFLPDVPGFLAAVAPASVCVTAVAVGKDIYQYDELLVTLTAEGARPLLLPLVFQTASVQAYENGETKPWVGLGAKDFRGAFAGALASAAWRAGPTAGATFSPLALAPSLFPPAAEVDSSSLSYALLPGLDSHFTTYLVTRLTLLDTGNPFTSQYLTQAAFVQVDPTTGATRYAPLSGIFDIVSQLEDLQENSTPPDASADPVQVLLGLAGE